jgi:predicted Fe-Mo cluster-binding NifX family protein
MIIACATDDGEHFISRHFGDANYYYIFTFENGVFTHIDTVTNTTEKEQQHADPIKAKSIVTLLNEKNIDVAVSKVFGPNIKKIKNHFVPVLVSVDDIESGLLKLKESLETINESIEAGTNRQHIDLRKK